MAFTITTQNNEKTFSDKELVNISSKPGFDYQLNVGFDFMLTIQYDSVTNKCVLLNQFGNTKFLFKGKPIPARLEIDKVCKIMVEGSSEFIMIKTLGAAVKREIAQEQMTEEDLRAIYGNDVNAAARLKVDSRKNEIEQARVSIVKEIGAKINDLKQKISMNSKGGIILHIALFLASYICAFGISNYITGLPLEDAGSVIQMPTNLKLIFIYAFIVFGVGMVLKQGVYLFMQNRLGQGTNVSNIAEQFMIILASIFYVAVYFINVVYYMGPNSMPFFAVLISLFFVGTAVTLALACGYFKNSSVETRKELNEVEYREDFEHVIREYQHWIERYANTLSANKIQSIKDKKFNLQIKGIFETIAGIITAPLLAYGVSNTLAMCFPEAAGWIRVSGLRFSPIFLLLATGMIIFAFFNFTSGFVNNKKVQGSNVIKQDGFSDYLQHGVEIYGIEGVKKIDKDMRRAFSIGLAIIMIEFSMNVSYFMQSIGGDLGGMLLAGVAALVPTALLIAETLMLSQTNFEIFACDTLISKTDK